MDTGKHPDSSDEDAADREVALVTANAAQQIENVKEPVYAQTDADNGLEEQEEEGSMEDDSDEPDSAGVDELVDEFERVGIEEEEEEEEEEGKGVRDVDIGELDLTDIDITRYSSVDDEEEEEDDEQESPRLEITADDADFDHHHHVPVDERENRIGEMVKDLPLLHKSMPGPDTTTTTTGGKRAVIETPLEGSTAGDIDTTTTANVDSNAAHYKRHPKTKRRGAAAVMADPLTGGGGAPDKPRRMHEQAAMTLGAAGQDDTGSLSDGEEEEENFVVGALCTAAEEGNVSGLQSLLDEVQDLDVNATNKHGESAVQIAAGAGQIATLQFLQQHGADILMRDKNNDSALAFAARQGQVDAVNYLLENQLPVNAQNKNGESALHLAARYGQTGVIDCLCKEDADVDLQDKLGETALHIAAWHDLPPPQVALLCSGKLDTQNQDGESALHCAASRGNLECVRCLVAHHANINLPDKRGCTALHLSTRRRHVSVALLLLHSGAGLDLADVLSETPLHAACREGLLPVVQTMCAFGADVEGINKSGNSPLQVVARSGNIEVARCLLLSGAEPNLPNKDGVTAEIVALAQGHQDVADLLSRLRSERRDTCIKQLMPVNKPLNRVKLKLFGNSGVGKSTLVESLKCGYFGSFFRKARLVSSNSVVTAASSSSGKENGSAGIERHHSLPTQLSYEVTNDGYTKAIDVQQVNIAGAGDVSVWEFSGYEPYYMLYDHFIGDPNCLHVVVYRADDPVETQKTQVMFWLHFIRARMAPMDPIGECGRQPWPARVLLVATHADQVPEGSDPSTSTESVLTAARQTFWCDFDLVDHVFVVDAHLAMAPELKQLRSQITDAKDRIVKNLPAWKGFLEAVVAALPPWRKVMGNFPVVTWPAFIEYVRAKVNLLASEEHMKEVMCQLQLIGEVIYIETESEKDLVALTPNWLCNEVLGELLSHTGLAHARPTGCFSVDDFQLLLPTCEAADLLPLLEALDLTTRCELDDDETEYEFPCYNFVETLNGLWERHDRRLPPPVVYAGLRLSTPAPRKQLLHLFPRLQAQLRRDALPQPDADLYQWHHGSKYCSGSLEALVTLEHNDQVIDVKCRAPAAHRTALHYFLDDVCCLLEDAIDDACPGLLVSRHPLSPAQLSAHRQDVHAYGHRDVLAAQLDESPKLVFSADLSETLVDVMACGSGDVAAAWTLGVDLPIAALSVAGRRVLCQLLDPTEALGRDWCVLAVSLGLTDQLPQLEASSYSHTARTLEVWASTRPTATVRELVQTLRQLGRADAADVVLTYTPLYHTPSPAQHDSQHTLSSSVSR